MPGSARDEAERLVAAVLGSVSVAAHGAGDKLANGSPECCVCPVCRMIAALRDPDPQAAERLASGAGDLAAGIAGLLRALGGVVAGSAPGTSGAATAGTAGAEGRSAATAGTSGTGAASAGGTGPAEAAAGEPDADDPWRAATRGAPPTPPTPRKPMAKKAVRKVVPSPEDPAP